MLANIHYLVFKMFFLCIFKILTTNIAQAVIRSLRMTVKIEFLSSYAIYISYMSNFRKLFCKYSISFQVSVNLHPENYRNRRRQARQAVVLSNDDQGIELTDFTDILDWVGDWAPEMAVGKISEFLWKIYGFYCQVDSYYLRV